jgi:4-amino-4-deoxy-L-arabinose transferase-like glycosyltransferase
MKVLKTIVFFVICSCMLYFSSNVSYAKSFGEIMNGGDEFVNSSSNQQIFNEDAQKKGASQLYFLALGVGIAAAVLVGVILGIQFITTGVEGQAKVKEKFLPYAIGCIVIFGAFGIWRLVVDIVQGVFD